MKLCPKCGANLAEVIRGYLCHECGGGMFSEDEVIVARCPTCNDELGDLCDLYYCYACSRSVRKEDAIHSKNISFDDESDFHSIIFSIHQKRYLLAKEFEKDFPEKAIDLYESCLLEQFNPYYFDRLSKLYKKHNMSDKRQESLSEINANIKRKIEIAESNVDKVVMEIINKTLELLDDVIDMNDDKNVLRILNRLKKNFELNSIEDNNFYECLIESFDELELLSPNDDEKLREIFHLIRGAAGRIHNGVHELERELDSLESS